MMMITRNLKTDLNDKFSYDICFVQYSDQYDDISPELIILISTYNQENLCGLIFFNFINYIVIPLKSFIDRKI